ncbi:MAG: hypothetical protein E6Q88_02250 [Lysobacteraceae bacterium]|nr:MAG: hypothetical protein E6Q88_02250 [Xanthomonadaceae bacterium]
MSILGAAHACGTKAHAVVRASLCLSLVCAMSACASAPRRSDRNPSDAPAQVAAPDAFFAAIRAHCGKAYAGIVRADTPPPANSPFADRPLVMHVRECGDDEIRIPFHVGEDRSRTWVLTRTASGLRLKHDHRHHDGSPDAVTQYGGDAASTGTAVRQEFPVDSESVENFLANGLKASIRNTWAIEIERDRRFVYELSRPDGRLFRVEFDLDRPVPAPPAPWGGGSSAD